MVGGPARDALVNDLERERLIMFGLYGTAAVAGAIGTWLYLRARRDRRGPHTGILIDGRGAGVWARF
jgi:hypothetical protein